MKKIILSIVTLSVFAFGYLEINDIVGKVIDAREAQYYRIFTDVPGFESARFVDNGDSILIELNTAIDSVHDTQYRNIDKKIYGSLDRYIKYFKRIIEDPKYRQRYIGEHAIGWPIISQREINEITRNLNDKIKVNNMNCMTSIASGSAYLGALFGRRILYDAGGCITIYVYSINPCIFGSVTAAGTMAGYFLMPKMDQNKIKNEALKKDILAFDLYQKPITIRDYKTEGNSTNQCIYGGAGCLVGLVASTFTLAILGAPWLFYEGDSDWDVVMTVAPMVIFSVSELAAIIKFFNGQGRKATIEKIKQKRMKEHLKKIEKTDR
jgi:hypothetical protein